MKKILVINPGSTSTKVALYHDDKAVWKETITHTAEEVARFEHPNEQLEFRDAAMHRALREAGIPMDFDAVIARGGLLKPTPGGVYIVDETVKHDLIHARMEHVCNLGALMADDIASEIGCPAYIADPEVVDEFMPQARISGLPELPRHSIFHALNGKSVSRIYADSIGRRYEDLNLIVVHLGGGISVAAHRHGRVVDVNNALNGDGPFSPERAGTLPADQLAEMCFSGKYTLREVKNMINGRGGLAAHLGTKDVAEVAHRAAAGEEPYRSVLSAMAYSVAKEVGARAVALKGKVDAIIITGGIAHSKYFVEHLTEWIAFIGPIVVRPGEDEVSSLAYNALGALNGRLMVKRYRPAEEAAPGESCPEPETETAMA